MRSLCAATLSLLVQACSGFEPVADLGAGAEAGPADGSMDRPGDGPTARDGGRDALELGPCPAGISAPVIDSFTITDDPKHVVLGQEVSLSVKAHGAAGQPLHVSYSVAPPGDAVTVQPNGSGRWALTTAKPVFFSTSFTITASVGHACGGPSATASVKLVETVQPPSHTFYFLRRFFDGYLFVHFFAAEVYRLDDTLKLESAPFATLPSGSWAAGMAWLDGV